MPTVPPPRVHELAQELGVDSGLLLAWLRAIGVTVDSASSSVPVDAAVRARTAHADGTLHAQPPQPPQPSQTTSPGDGFVAPRSTRSWSRVLAESRRRSTAWEEYWIPDEERREWMAAGLGPDDGRIAGRLRDRGFVPDDLLLRVDGVRASERLRGGEPVSLVIARLRELRRTGQSDAG
jgi:hypothetical protein